MDKDLKRKLNSCDITVLIQLAKVDEKHWELLLNNIIKAGGTKQ